MDRRSWPWKKKSSDKANIEKTLAASDSTSEPLASDGSQRDKVNKKPKYVQISVETYSHLTGMEDQVKAYEEQVQSYEDQVKSYEDQIKSFEDQVSTYEDQIGTYEDQVQSLEDEVKDLNEKLSEANSEMTTKENLVKQHAKVAEEAVSGWEKAEAEAAALKVHLESVTLSKLTAEDRASHLDGALKECMRQIRNLKEEHEQHIHDVMFTKSKQLDKLKLEFEAKIANLDQELLRSASDNATLSRSLQECSNMLMKMTEEKSHAEAEIEMLKSNVDSCEREINSLKYELHLIAKELEIRNEEKNMSVRSAEVANKQHLEGVKKIAKLEAECQRLRGLVRKKLPGPAALAQMKLEVENLGRDYGDSRLRRSPVKTPSTPHFPPTSDFSLDSLQKFHKENELLTERLLGMEEETKMLKEALAKRNSELQTSRNVCAKTVSKLQSLEAQLQGTTRSGAPLTIEGTLSQNASNPPSLTSMSEEGNDDAVSCAGSWATNLMSEISHNKKEKCIDSPRKTENANHLELMDDFLEMEKLAYSSNNSPGPVNTRADSVNQPNSDASSKPTLEESSVLNPESDKDLLPIIKLQSKITVLLESLPKGADEEKVFEEISRVVHNICIISNREIENDDTCAQIACSNDREVISEKEIACSRDNQELAKNLPISNEELEASISRIHDFVLLLGKETKSVQVLSTEGDGLVEKLEEFSAAVTEVVDRKIGLTDFVICLSHVLGKASEFRFNVLGYENNETSSTDCIDKVALPENKLVQEPSEEIYANGCAHFSDSTSDPDIPNDGSFVPTSETNVPSWKCSMEEFEQLKLEKENTVLDLARCTENLESTKSHLKETEQALAEVKSQLTSAQKLNGLAETQLKCMAESYNSLETRAEDLQTQVNLLRAKVETLDNELQVEKLSHQDAEARCQDLLDQLQRIESSPAIDIDAKNNQEKELAMYAEKLAECQETIFLLGKQMKGWRPQTEYIGSPYNDRSQKEETFLEEQEEPTTSNGMSLHDLETTNMGNESPINIYTAPFSPSESEGNKMLKSPISSKHRPTKSGSSSSSSSNPTPEKNARGISRFFSSKGKV